MAVGLPAVGELSYNTFDFDGASSVKVEAKRVRDEANRTVIYHFISITVTTTISTGDGTSTDASLDQIHHLLSEDGQALKLDNAGFGTLLNVNGPGGVKDVKWGPKTEILTWEPVGSHGAAFVVWHCTTCIPICENMGTLGLGPAGVRDTGIMAMNYEARYSIDNFGFTDRVISGYLEIAQSTTTKKIPDSADNYRENLEAMIPATLDGFIRQREFADSKDKSRLDFSVIDKQIRTPQPYPPGAAMITGTASREWSRTRAANFINAISIEITRRNGITGAQCWQIFQDIVSKRRQFMQAKGGSTLLDRLKMDEDLFGYSCRFSCTFRQFGQLSQFFSASGMWQPLNYSWQLWKQDMAKVWGPRGIAGLTLTADCDAIVDLCGDGNLPQIVEQNNQTTKPANNGNQSPFQNTTPPAGQSWGAYDARLVPRRYAPVVRQPALQKQENVNGNLTGSFGGSSSQTQSQQFQNSTQPFQFPQASAIPDVIQQRGSGRYSVAFYGTAERAGYQIPRPALLSLGGQQAIEVFSAYELTSPANLWGVPLFRLNWYTEYVIAGSPGTVGYPDNIQQGIFNGQAQPPTA